jgi:mannitol/fructose-specific phosphotransferase system IIA component (Ntr-type)
MKISTILRGESVLFLESIDDKWKLIELMTARISDCARSEALNDEVKKSLLSKVVEREKQAPTGLGEGIAFPHARISGLNEPLMGLALLENGVDFGAPDAKPANIVILFLFPANRHEIGVKIQSVCTRFLIDADNRRKLSSCRTPEDIREVLDIDSLEIDAPITAFDLMREEKVRFSPKDILKEATIAMNSKVTNAAPVTDEAGNCWKTNARNSTPPVMRLIFQLFFFFPGD